MVYCYILKACSNEQTESRIFKPSLKARFIEDKRRKTHKKNFSKKYPRLALYLFCSPSITSGKNFWKFAVTHYILNQVPSRHTKYLKSKCSLLILFNSVWLSHKVFKKASVLYWSWLFIRKWRFWSSTEYEWNKKENRMIFHIWKKRELICGRK